MATSNEFIPMSMRTSQVYPQYVADERPSQVKFQAWSQESPQAPFIPERQPNDSSASSCAKHLTLKLFMSIFVGLVICGVPLAVMSSLYVQKKASSNTSTTGSSASLPSQCSSYVVNADPTRLTTWFGCTNCIVDSGSLLPTGWYRFIEAGGTQLAQTPVSNGACGTSYPAYFNGTFPTVSGASTSGTMCVNFNGNLCSSSYPMSPVTVTDCGGYFVFYLTTTPWSTVRYCTTP